MNHPYRRAASLLSGVYSDVLHATQAMRLRVQVQHLRLTSALAMTLCFVALLSAPATTQASRLGQGTDFQPRRAVVQLKAASSSVLGKINARHGSTTLDKLPGKKGAYLLKLPASSDTQEAVRRLKNDPRVLYAEKNFVAELPEGDGRHRAYGISSTEGSSEQYAASALNLSGAAAISLGEGTTVAVIDTGAQLDHPALKANLEGVARYDFVDKDKNPSERPIGKDQDGDGEKDEMVGHGTHVAGIVDFVAPSAKIMPLRVLDTEGYGNTFTIAKAILYARQNGAEVINLSLGTSSHSKLLQDVIEDAVESGVVVAAAAGNSNASTPHYPAAGDGVAAASADGLVAVTSVDRYEKKSDFANYGIWVDIAAPGTDIRSAFPPSLYANWSGTSMATPFISGQAALIRTLYGSLDPAGTEKMIRTSARPLHLQDPVYGEMLGSGHADVCASLLQSN